MSSNALSVTALEQTSFQFFAESVWAHSSSTQFCRQSVPRRRSAHSERATTRNSSCRLTVQGATDRGTQLSSPGQWWYQYTVAAEVDWCSIVQALVHSDNLYVIRWQIGSQWSSRSIGVMWSNFLAPVTKRAHAAAFCMNCNLLRRVLEIPYRR